MISTASVSLNYIHFLPLYPPTNICKGFFPDWHGLIHHSIPKLTIKAASHSITSPPDTATASKPQLNIKTATIKRPKSIPKSVTEWLKFITISLLYGLGILMFYTCILSGPSSHATALSISHSYPQYRPAKFLTLAFRL